MSAEIRGSFGIHRWHLDKAGDLIKGHKHSFPHLAVISRGSIRLRIWVQAVSQDGAPLLDNDGNEIWHLRPGSQVFRAGDDFDVPSELGHEFKALEAHTSGLCIFHHRDPVTHMIVETANGWSAAHG